MSGGGNSVDGFVTDDAIYEAAEEAANAIIELLNSESSGAEWVAPPGSGTGVPAGRWLVNSMRAEAGELLEIDPQQVLAEGKRLHGIGKAISPNTDDVLVQLGALERQTGEWYGPAADEFKEQKDAIQGFLANQSEAVAKLPMRALIALLGVSAEVRQSYLELAAATTGQARDAKDDVAKENTEFAISVGVALVSSAAALEPKAILSAGVSASIGLAGEILKQNISGDKADAVISSYKTGLETLRGRYEDALRRIKTTILKQDEIDGSPKLAEPLPASVEVTSPDFRYENFYSKEGDPDRIAERVAEERARYAGQLGGLYTVGGPIAVVLHGQDPTGLEEQPPG